MNINSKTRTGLIAFSAVILVGAMIAFVANAMSSRKTRPKLTHKITRGDLVITVTEQGMLESSVNTEIKSQVRGRNTVIWVIESGSVVKKGDVLLEMDTLFIEEQIDERTKYANWSRSSAERSAAQVARSELAVKEYEQGRYVSEVMAKKTELAIAEARLNSAKNKLSHARELVESDYASELEIEEKEFAVKQADLRVKLRRTELEVLENYTKAEELQTLRGNFAATKANHNANAERAMADASRRDRSVAELPHCTVRAPQDGLVIHPNAAKWEFEPIAEGSTIHKDKVLLLMPDLNQMQVKVGVHESLVDRLEVGQSASVSLPEQTLKGTVSEISSITKPAGLWTGNEVRYDTIVKLPNVPGLNPGMSAEVEITVARHEDVLTIPVAAIVELDEGSFCWIKTKDRTVRRQIELGETNDIFTIVKKGLTEGDEVILNPPQVSSVQTSEQSVEVNR